MLLFVVKHCECVLLRLGCPAETYKWSMGTDPCVACPHGSSAVAMASDQCQCDNGYYRAPNDKPSAPCTRMYDPRSTVIEHMSTALIRCEYASLPLIYHKITKYEKFTSNNCKSVRAY